MLNRKPVAPRILRDDPLDAGANSLGDSFSLFGTGGLGRGDAMVDKIALDSSTPDAKSEAGAPQATPVTGFTLAGLGDGAINNAVPPAISLTAGVTYSQNFNTLATTGTTNTLAIDGWTMNETGGSARDNDQYAADTGSSSTGDTYSYGSAPGGIPSADRALGSLLSSSLISGFGAAFTNNTGATITQLAIAYTAEQWRIGNTTAARDDRLDFQISTDATSLTVGTYTDVNQLDAVNAIKTAATAGALDGNAAANRTAVNYTITGLSIAPGATFWIRWNDLNASGSDDGVAIDDFSLTATTGVAAETQTVAFNPASVTLAEGNSGTTLYSFTVTRTGGTTGDLTFSGTIAAGTTDGADYLGGTAPTTFSGAIAAGAASATVTIAVNGDATVEGDEAFTLTLNTVGNASPGVTTTIGTTASATGTILNDDGVVPQPGALSIADASVTEGNSGTVAIDFIVSRTGGDDGAVGATYTVTFGTADAGDFATGQAFTGTVAFADGETSRTITLNVAGDTAIEPSETFTVTLSAETGGATLADASATGTITNDDLPSLSIGDVQVIEGNGGTANLLYTVTASAPAPAGGISFTIATADGTATAASGDYAAQSATGTIAAGQTSYTFTVAVNGDVVAEANETVLVNLSNVTGASVADAQAAGTIVNDDGVPASARLFAADFAGFTAAGFAPNPGVGQLDSDVWRVIGLSDNPNPTYGATYVTGDFARGRIVGAFDPVSAGVYSPSANDALVVQPTGAEFVEGTGAIEARIQNTSGYTAISFDVAFDWAYRNSGGRAEGLKLSYSTDGVTFTAAPASAFITPVAADGTTAAAVFSNAPVRAAITDIAVADGGFLYLRFNHTSSTGGGNRDEVGIDNLTVDAGLSDASVLTFTDLTVTEGDSGTSLAVFTLTRTNASGAASINFATADGVALAGSDYAAQSGTVTFADGEATKQIQIAINGDLRNEPNESFFINLTAPTGFLLPDTQARITIANNDTGPVPIYDIQGLGHRSTYVGLTVVTSGIVTAVDTNGYYLQDPTGDGNARTSDGIFVFTNTTAPGVAVGDSVSVTGTVTEFQGGPAGLSVTRISGPTTSFISAGNPLPVAVLIGTGGRQPPSAVIEDDGFTSYEPATDGLDFYESLEGMRVTIDAPLVTDRTNGFGETQVVASGGVGATGVNARGGITISAGDFNPERIQIDDDSGIFAGFTPNYSQGDRLSSVTGIVNYAFDTYEVLVTAAVTVTQDVTLADETSTLVEDADHLSIATYNLENLDPSDGKYTILANDIVFSLLAPDIIAVQEIQDNDGAGNGADLSGRVNAQGLIDAIFTISGKTYAYIEIAPTTANSTGGEPNGNIRNGYFYDSSRVSYITGSAALIEDPSNATSRRPLVAQFSFNNQTITTINVHSTSRGGSDPLFGATQPPLDAGEGARIAQSNAVKAYINNALATDPARQFVLMGDFNGFYFEESLTTLTANGLLTNLLTLLPVEERYSYFFEGNAQALDNILVSGGLLSGAKLDAVHINAETPAGPTRPTDHDPQIVLLRIPVLTAASEGSDQLNGTPGNNVIDGLGGDDFFRLEQGGDDDVDGGSGNDAFYFGGAFTAADTVDGGTGADVVAIQGNYANLLLGAGSLVDVETLTILTGADARFGDTAGNRYDYNVAAVDANVAAGTQLKVNASTLLVGEDLTFNGSAESDGSFFIYGGMGVDTLTGGAGADVFFMAEGRLGASDSFNGGGGADILVLRGDYSVSFGEAGAGSSIEARPLTGIETVTLMSAADTRFFSGGERYNYSLIIGRGNVAEGATLTINGAQLRADEHMFVDARQEAAGSFRLFGGAGKDFLIGGVNADVIYGGLGADELEGHGGNDRFQYNATAESTSGDRDSIFDFRTGDVIDLSRIDAIAGTPEDDAFAFIGSAAFGNVAGQLRAEQNGAIWTVQGDVDGDGIADIEFLVTVTDSSPIIASDFIL